MERVYCLYRVSIKEQVDEDDIPMQRKACHVFQGRELVALEIVPEEAAVVQYIFQKTVNEG